LLVDGLNHVMMRRKCTVVCTANQIPARLNVLVSKPVTRYRCSTCIRETE